MEQIARGTIADNEKYAELLHGRISRRESELRRVDLSPVTQLEPRKWTESELENLEVLHQFTARLRLSLGKYGEGAKTVLANKVANPREDFAARFTSGRDFERNEDKPRASWRAYRITHQFVGSTFPSCKVSNSWKVEENETGGEPGKLVQRNRLLSSPPHGPFLAPSASLFAKLITMRKLYHDMKKKTISYDIVEDVMKKIRNNKVE
ncbi:hypothetical protein WN51_11128 [Melipona quadrifasciata]|uniref:Uncharacterized protein n=1 Tax=Melipona quadrifasciata TaxID=166423 RepID=A0A0N0U6H2_9HYME|nr:hypothetical protein WN51_11128 [Melipona quadrifasciata]